MKSVELRIRKLNNTLLSQAKKKLRGGVSNDPSATMVTRHALVLRALKEWTR